MFSKIQGETIFETTEKQWDHFIGRKTWTLSDVFDSANLAELGELLETLGRSLIALDAIKYIPIR